MKAVQPEARGQDISKQAPIAPNLEVWLRSPATLDFPGVDVKLSANPVERRKQAEDLVQIATKKALEIEMRKPNDKKPLRRFRVVKKEEAEKLELNKKPPQETEMVEQKLSSEPKGRKLPTKEEILQRAKEMFMEQQARLGLPAITPEETELKEAGLFDQARADLMRGEDTKTDPQILQYIDNLKAELEPMGFSIVQLNS